MKTAATTYHSIQMSVKSRQFMYNRNRNVEFLSHVIAEDSSNRLYARLPPT